MKASVKDIEVFEDTIKGLGILLEETDSVCGEQLSLCQRVLSECTTEHAFTKGLLLKAQTREAAAIADLASKEGKLAALYASEASALASENYVRAADIARRIPPATEAVRKAAEELKKATKHRKDMEKRMELAEKALKIAEIMDERTQRLVGHHYSQLESVKERATRRLTNASQDTHQYDAQKNVNVSQDVLHWAKWKPTSHNLSPEMLGQHFSQMPSHMIGDTLQDLYERVPEFRDGVNTLRVTTKNSADTLKLQEELSLKLMEGLVVAGVSALANDIQVRACWVNEEKDIQVKLALQGPTFSQEEGTFPHVAGKVQLNFSSSNGTNVNINAQAKGVIPYTAGQLQQFCLDFVHGKQEKNSNDQKEMDPRGSGNEFL